MLSSSFYPFLIFFDSVSQLDSLPLWGLLIISVGINLHLFKQNKKLRAQLKPKKNQLPARLKKPLPALKPAGFQTFSELENEMNDSLFLEEDDLVIEAPEPVANSNGLYSLIQSISGWHKSLVPFLLQNIGWFIGVLCFISGSIFFISYTEGFNKSLTIFYTVLSYTLLLAWGGYRLKDKVSHASTSAYVLMATSFLLTPLNFTAATQLLGNSIGTFQFFISIASTLIAFGSLYYTSRLISGLFNRHLLTHFSPVFFTLSCLQLLVPWVQQGQSIFWLLIVQISIIGILLWALINYMPALLKQVFIDRKYLLLMSAGSLIYTALVSFIHITMSSPVPIELNYYAPIILLLSSALFYMDGQLNDYKEQMKLLSYFSFVSYAVSFIAIAISVNVEPIRYLTVFLAVLLYARLIWLYRSLVPLYLVFILLGFLQFDMILSDWLLSIPGMSSDTIHHWFFLASFPLLLIAFLALRVLRKSESLRGKTFSITRHLFHIVMISSMSLSIYSQWTIALYYFTETSSFSVAVFLNLCNSLIVFFSSYYLLKSQQINAYELSGHKFYSVYLYLLLILPVIHILLSFQVLFSMDIKLVFICLLVFFYSLNSRYDFISFYGDKENEYDGLMNRQMNRKLFINMSIVISLLLLSMAAAGYSLSIKNALLFFIISLNFLFLSLNLLNRALFYFFLMIVSVAILTIKLYLSHSPSTGFLVISSALLIFYFIHWLDGKRKNEIERINIDISRQDNPDKILGFYPVKDYCIEGQVEETNNVQVR